MKFRFTQIIAVVVKLKEVVKFYIIISNLDAQLKNFHKISLKHKHS